MFARAGPSLLARNLRPGVQSTLSAAQIRLIHTPLPLEPALAEGAAPFLSKDTVRVVAVDWQKGLLDRLNDEVRQTELETLSVATTVLQTRGDRYQTQAFNLASMALNNSFFFSNLRPEPRMADEGSSPTEGLKDAITKTFGSVAELQKAVQAIADGMTSTGWIWLASDVAGNLGIIPSYGAGTAMTPFRMQAGNIDARLSMERSLSQAFPSTPSPVLSNSEATQTTSAPEAIEAQEGQEQPVHQAEEQDAIDSILQFENLSKFTPFTYPPEIGKHRHQRPITPLFNISLQEHAWALDYGVWGRDKYLANFWKCLDWTEPNRAYQRVVRELLKV